MIANLKQSIGQYRSFMDYRFQAYKTELTQLLLQLKSFGLLFLVVLGSSILGLILLLFLGLGKIIDSSDAPQCGAQMAWLYFLLQSVMLSAMKSAIKNSAQRTFQQTLVKQYWLGLMDIKLLLLSHGWLIASLVIAVDLSINQWLKVPHFLVFILLQFILGILCLYKPLALVYGFLLSAIWLMLPFDVTPLIYQCGFVLLFALSTSMAPFNFSAKLDLSSLRGFWLMFFIHNSWTLIWRGALLLCVFMASEVLLQERANLAVIFSILSLAFVVLFSSSLQFDCSRLHQQYNVFFKMQNKQTAFFASQFIPSLAMLLPALIGYMILFNLTNSLLVLIGIVWCLLQQVIAQKKPAHYALVWMITTGGLLATLT
jgi:hypothetical protein